MKHSYTAIFLVIFTLLASCVSKEYELEIERLKRQIKANDNFMQRSDSTMLLITSMLDSIDTQQHFINTGYENAKNKEDSVFLRIEGARLYIERSREEIRCLERDLREEIEKNGDAAKRVDGLMATIRRLKGQLKSKEDSLVVLNDKLMLAEQDKKTLNVTVKKQQQTIQSKDSLLNDREKAIQEQADLLARTQQEAEEKARLAKLERAERYFNMGKSEETLGDKTMFAPNKKREHYAKAEEHYEEAFNLGFAEAKDAMYSAKEKAMGVWGAKKKRE